MSEQVDQEAAPVEAAPPSEAGPIAAESSAVAPSAVARSSATSSVAPGLAAVLDVPLRVTVEIGSARMLVQEVLQLGPGSVIALDRMAGEPADLLVNGRVVGRGEVIVSEDRLSIRLVEITGGDSVGEDHE